MSSAKSNNTPLYRRPSMVALVFLGGMIGTFFRHGLNLLFPQTGVIETFAQYGIILNQAVLHWPITTLVINVVGAFILGMLLESLSHSDQKATLESTKRRLRNIRLGVGTGVLGAFTTYSTLAVDTDLLFYHNQTSAAVSYALASVILGFAASSTGIVISAKRAARKGL